MVIRIIFLFLFFQSSCISAKHVKADYCENCNDKTDCSVLVKCGDQYFNGFYERRINDSLSLDRILTCTAEAAKKGDLKAHKMLYDYFQKRYNYYYESKYPASAIADFYYTREVEIFSEMRGVDIFELALKFGKETICIDHGDMAGGGNIGLSVIEYIINPMIKSVGGELNMRGYLNVDNYKNRSVKPTSPDPCQRAHEVVYGELIKAYKEGKIVLKKYGDPDNIFELETQNLELKTQKIHEKQFQKMLKSEVMSYEFIINTIEPFPVADYLLKSDPSTNKDVHRHLLNYYKDLLVKNEVIKTNSGMEGYVSPEELSASAFAKLRGKEAFELALQYASKTKCVNVKEHVGYGGNVGLKIIQYIIAPMIKSIAGYKSLNLYLNAENGINKSINSSLADPCLKVHEEYYGELIKAYKEGKIILKKYGED